MKEELTQRILEDAGVYLDKIDGDFGPKSRAAAEKYHDFPDEWKTERVVTGVIQVAAIRKNIPVGDVDGLWGQKTQTAYEKLLQLYGLKTQSLIVDPSVTLKTVYNSWPKQNYDSMVKYYGEVGKNQTSLTLPYQMKLAWDLEAKVNKITCHEKVKDSLERIFKNTLDHYGKDAIEELRLDRFGGCLNVRKMRGGSSWSIHSWGAAVDLDPDRNQLKWGKDKAIFAKKEFEPFWKIVEAEGWVSLGRDRNYDWMHFQAAKL